MTMQLEFSPEDLKELDYERFRHPLPMVQRRMEAFWVTMITMKAARFMI